VCCFSFTGDSVALNLVTVPFSDFCLVYDLTGLLLEVGCVVESGCFCGCKNGYMEMGQEFYPFQFS